MAFSENQKFIWPVVVVVLLAAAAATQIYRVNHKDTPTESKTAIAYTSGPVVDGPILVPAGGHLPFRIVLNRRANLKGTFTTGKNEMQIACFVIKEEDLENWKSGGVYKRISETGYVPRGNVDVALDAGQYYLIFDNRRGTDKPQAATAGFSVE